jgi:hypothetical protein
MTTISLNSLTQTPQISTLVDNPSMLSACFPVSTVPLGYNLSGEFKNIDRVGVLRQDTNEIMYVGSNNYKLVKNEDIMLALDPLFRSGYEGVKVRNIHGKRFMFELRTEAFEDLTINNYPCVGRIRVCNSYDGSTALTLQFGVYIQVCSNGLCVPAHVFTGNIDVKYKHTTYTPEDITSWIHNSTIGAMPFIRKSLEGIVFHEGSCDRKLQRIADLLPKPSKGIHPIIEALINQTRNEIQEHKSNENFGLFMALTNMATFPDKYGIAASYVETLEEAATSLFI